MGKEFRWAEVAPDQALALWNERWPSISNRGAERVDWFNQAGQFTRREKGAEFIESPPNILLSLAFPSLAAVVPVIFWLYPYTALEVGVAESLSAMQWATVEELWPTLVFVTLLSTWLACACYRRQMRYARTASERAAWPLFVFIGGLPGWVAFRYADRWPVMARCPSCGASVPRDREMCAACRQDFPLPEREGLEILAV